MRAPWQKGPARPVGATRVYALQAPHDLVAGQGVPARWVIDRSWRNPWLFEPRPWYCFLCGREYLPGDGAIALWVRFGFRNEDTGAFVPHDEGEWPAGLHYTPAWYHKALDLWWDRPGFAQSTTVYAHSWHFQPTDQFVPAVEVLSSDQITDTHTGQVYLEREVPAWAETLTYAARWTRARVRGVMHFPLFLFRAAWAWAWSVQPIAGLHAWAYALDGLVQALGMAKGPWPASMLLLNTLWGRPANVDWYMDLCQED